MLKFNRTQKRLVIPAGINPNYGIDSSALYNTSDADAKPEDILAGITAYSDNGKIVGTLDVETEKEESFNEGVQMQKSKLESISITENGSYSREDGWNEVIVEVPDLNGDYNEGLEDGIEIGKAEIIDGMNDATITANAVLEGYIGYGKDNERIVGTNVGGFNFGEIGYSDADSNDANGAIKADIAYSKTLYDAWDPNNTSASQLYASDSSMVYAPNIDLSNVTTAYRMFYDCKRLLYVPLLNTTNVTYMNYMFYNCTVLTSVPQFDTSNANNMGSMFHGCKSLTTIPHFNTSNVTNMGSMFESCDKLTSIPQLDTSKVTSFNKMFGACPILTTIPELDWSGYKESYGGSEIFGVSYSNAPNIENIGGFKDAGKSYSSSNSYNTYKDIIICYSPKLTHESCMNVINKVYDMHLNTENTYTPKIRFHATPYASLSADDIAIATAKGWAVQAG